MRYRHVCFFQQRITLSHKGEYLVRFIYFDNTKGQASNMAQFYPLRSAPERLHEVLNLASNDFYLVYKLVFLLFWREDKHRGKYCMQEESMKAPEGSKIHSCFLYRVLGWMNDTKRWKTEATILQTYLFHLHKTYSLSWLPSAKERYSDVNNPFGVRHILVQILICKLMNSCLTLHNALYFVCFSFFIYKNSNTAYLI